MFVCFNFVSVNKINLKEIQIFMNTFKTLCIIALGMILITTTSCEKDDDDNINDNQAQFKSLSSPYLICAGRNPGGVGFDFEYNGETGGANNIDSLTVSDFQYDMKTLTIKAEKPDGSLGGMPYIALAINTEAINYSSVDPTCKGYTNFQNLTKDNLQQFVFQIDDSEFDLSNLETGSTGKPLMSATKNEFLKLVIGDKWKKAANNNISDDEPVWIIKTVDDCWVKMIVTDFPADPAPTATGYVGLKWEFLK